jgi:hypothetical protein
MPSYVYRRPAFDRVEHYATPAVVVSDSRRREVREVADGVTIAKLPTPDSDHSIGAIGEDTERRLGIASISLDAQAVRMPDGTWLSAAYAALGGSQIYTSVLLESRDGFAWKLRSVIADVGSGLSTGEAASEPALCRLKDGRLMCVFRTGVGPYGQTWSADDGRTWSRPVAMAQRSALPRLLVRRDGAVILLGGRPGIFLWLDRTGTGTQWEALDLRQHHNARLPDEPILDNDEQHQAYGGGRSSSYISAAFLDDDTLVVVYDRTAIAPFDLSRHRFNEAQAPAAPVLGPEEPVADRLQTFSCWIVRVRFRR